MKVSIGDITALAMCAQKNVQNSTMNLIHEWENVLKKKGELRIQFARKQQTTEK